MTKIKGKPSYRKHYKKYQKRELILIVCEGEATEPNYFKSFRLATLRVEAVGTGRGSCEVVKEAEKYYKKYLKSDNLKRKNVWCVFDKDVEKINRINDAFRLAEKKCFNVAFSNECFELWYVLHFNFHQARSHRDDYCKILSDKLKMEYKKNDPDIHDLLKDKVLAIKNAKKLEKIHGNEDYSNKNPYTSVYNLVEFLSKNEI